MEAEESKYAPRWVTGIWAPLVLLAIAVFTLAIAVTYPPVASRAPVMVCIAMIVLTILDIWSRTSVPGHGIIKTFGGTGFERREMMHNPSVVGQLEGVGWIAACFVLMACVGILAASPIFAATYVRLHGKRKIAVAGLVGLAVLAFQFAVFEWALDYGLYRGLFFTRGGISAW